MSWKSSARKSRLRQAGVSGWEEQRRAQRVLERDAHRCYRCGGHATRADHVIPLARGGDPGENNLRAICDPCHKQKTQSEAAGARQRLTNRRPPEPHPGRLPQGGGGPRVPPGLPEGSVGAVRLETYETARRGHACHRP